MRRIIRRAREPVEPHVSATSVAQIRIIETLQVCLSDRGVIEVIPVYLSNIKVTASNAQSQIPVGFRQATLEQVALRYYLDPEFEQELSNKGAAWTSQIGLESSGYQEIYLPVEFSNPSERISFHHSGTGPVAVFVDSFNGRGGGLVVYADCRPSSEARVAYVPVSQAGSVAAVHQLEIQPAQSVNPTAAVAAFNETAWLDEFKATCRQADAVGNLSSELEGLPASEIVDREKHKHLRDRISRHRKLPPVLGVPMLAIDLAQYLIHRLIFHGPSFAAEKVKKRLRRRSIGERGLAAIGYGSMAYAIDNLSQSAHLLINGKILIGLLSAVPQAFVLFASKLSFMGRNELVKKRRIAQAKELEAAVSQEP